MPLFGRKVNRPAALNPVRFDLKVMRSLFRPFAFGIPAMEQFECLSGVARRILVSAAVPCRADRQVKGMRDARIAAALLRPFQYDIRQIVGTRRDFRQVLKFALRLRHLGPAQEKGIKVLSFDRRLCSGLPVRLGRGGVGRRGLPFR